MCSGSVKSDLGSSRPEVVQYVVNILIKLLKIIYCLRT